MYRLTVRDHVMIAHSLPHPAFGPAQGLHGATYVVEATWVRPDLDQTSCVIDIGLATGLLRRVLAELDYRNLDDLPAFAGRLTTTEVVADHVLDRLCAEHDTGAYTALEVTLREHPDAWATVTRHLPER